MRRACGVVLIVASAIVPACVNRTDVGSFDEHPGAGDAGASETGDGSESTVDVPRATTALTSAISSSCALDAKGGVWCWGSNLDGALGTGVINTEFHPPPAAGVKGLTQGVAAVSGGNQGYCAVLADGTVRCWGNLPAGNVAEPSVVAGIGPDIARVTVGDGFACALDTHGHARCWGAGNAGQLGNRSTDDRPQPKEVVATGEPLLDISASSFSAFACGVGASGRVFCWGSGAGGQLGRVAEDSAVPAAVEGLAGPAVSVATGALFACALLRGGGVTCWGANDAGQLGTGSAGSDPVPLLVGGVEKVTALALGERHACALVEDGSVVCWGAGYGGAIPGQSKIAKPTVVIPSSFGAKAIAAGYQSTCALATGGRVRCFGSAGISWSADASFTL